MPSLKKKVENSRQRAHLQNLLVNKLPRLAVLEIGLFLCSERFKVALKFMSICKKFHQVCNESNLFWFSLFAHKFPERVLVEFEHVLSRKMGVSEDPEESARALKRNLEGWFDEEEEIRF